jgi:2,3-dihydroxybiphenyl 1,2-dioxygenase
MSLIRTLGYVGVETAVLEPWREFAAQMIGLEIGATLPDGTLVLRMDGYQGRIFVHPGQAEDIVYAGWEVRDAEALAALHEQLAAAGLAVEKGSAEAAKRRGVMELISFADAEGLAQEAYFGASVCNDRPFCSPSGSVFMTGEQGVGHIVLAAKDYAAQTKFYNKTLGFRLSDFCDVPLPFPPFGGHITFMRCNPRHHSLAVGNFGMGKRMGHLMLELASLDQVGQIYARAKKAGAHILMDLGRHTNDQMFSFYVMTPSGWPIEVGWGAIAVDEETWHVTHHSAPSSWGHEISPPPRPAPLAKDSIAAE